MTARTRWMAALLAVLLLGLAGCGEEDPASSAAPSTSISSSSSSSPSSSSPSSSSPSAPLSSESSLSLPPSSSQAPASDETPDAGDPAAPSGDIATEPAALAAAQPTFDPASLPNERLSWGQGVQFNEDNQPIASVLNQQTYGKYDAYFIGPDEDKVIYLTFDQGYENGYTADILDTLKEKGVPATFFLVGDYVERNGPLVERMIAEGHAVGNHSWGHKDATTLSIEEAEEELAKLHDLVAEQYGVEMTLYRPPSGVYSERTLSIAQNAGYRTIFWSFAYKDWEVDNQPDPAEALERTVARAHNGAIYLLHSVSSTNAAILGDLIDALTAEGYRFASLA